MPLAAPSTIHGGGGLCLHILEKFPVVSTELARAFQTATENGSLVHVSGVVFGRLFTILRIHGFHGRRRAWP